MTPSRPRNSGAPAPVDAIQERSFRFISPAKQVFLPAEHTTDVIALAHMSIKSLIAIVAVSLVLWAGFIWLCLFISARVSL